MPSIDVSMLYLQIIPKSRYLCLNLRKWKIKEFFLNKRFGNREECKRTIKYARPKTNSFRCGV